MIFENIIGPARPISWVLRFWPILAAAFVGSLAATWLCKKIALRYGIVDEPDELVKTHKEPVAYLGGVGMLVGLTVGILAAICVIRNEPGFGSTLRWLLGILAGGAIACWVGVTDDILDIKPWQKLLGQFAAGVVLILVGITPALHYITDYVFGWQMPSGLETVLRIPIVVIFVLGATNSLNLLDGLDGLCGGVTTIITVALLLLAIHLATWGTGEVNDPVRVIICLAMLGAVCGFLPFNRHPAKIFMGDAGSMLLGFEVAALMVLFWQDIPRWWMASVVVFGLPILDTATALVRRMVNKRPLFVSDRGHIYDQMIDRGVSLKRTVAFCYVLAGVYAVIGLVMSQIRTRYAAIVYVFVFAISGFIVWKKGYLKMEGLRGAIHKKD